MQFPHIFFLGKVVGKVFAWQLQKILDETAFLNPYQCSFRPSYSTEISLVTLTDGLWWEQDGDSATIRDFLDLLAASNIIDNGILLDQLWSLGLGSTVLCWFSSCFQSVLIGCERSSPWPLSYAVPQGLVLSPLPFNIYMNIHHHKLKYHQYASDIKLYISIFDGPSDTVAILWQCLEAVGACRGTRGYDWTLTRPGRFGYMELQDLSLWLL